MKIVYCSDLHLEVNGSSSVVDKKWAPGDVLVLAGDICTAIELLPHMNDQYARATKKALNYLKAEVFPQYNEVIKVMGNHTHYRGAYPETYGLVKEFFADVPNFHLLENES